MRGDGEGNMLVLAGVCVLTFVGWVVREWAGAPVDPEPVIRRDAER